MSCTCGEGIRSGLESGSFTNPELCPEHGRGGSIFELEPGCPSYLIPKSATDRHNLGALERMNEAPHKTYTWCWTHGLIRGRHDCTTTKED